LDRGARYLGEMLHVNVIREDAALSADQKWVATARRGPQLRFRPAVSSRKQRASSAFVLPACGKYT